MAPEKKLESPVTLFAAIESRQHAALRSLAFKEDRSIAELVREALDDLIAARSRRRASTVANSPPRRLVRRRRLA